MTKGCCRDNIRDNNMKMISLGHTGCSKLVRLPYCNNANCSQNN